MRKKPDYRKDVEKAARQMILVHRVDTLIKLILRTIVRTLGARHAGFLLYAKVRDDYVVKISHGRGGLKVPSGFTKVGKDNVLIRYFEDEKLRIFGDGPLLLDKINKLLNSRKARRDKKLKIFLEAIKFQFSLYNVKACIPGFFRDKLICVLLLGAKANSRAFTQDELGFLSVLSSDTVMAIQNAWFFQDLTDQLQINRDLFLQTVKALATAIDAKDQYTAGHTERVSNYSLIIAEEVRVMKKIPRKEWESFFQDLKIASLLHDIGKIGISESVLNKNGALNTDERREIERHPLVGYSILSKVDKFQEPILGVKYHHERFDGTGYPEGLKGKKIPLIAQVIAVADVFDALIADRPYRSGFSKEEAVETIRKNKSKHFSPLMVDAFLRAYTKGKI